MKTTPTRGVVVIQVPWGTPWRILKSTLEARVNVFQDPPKVPDEQLFSLFELSKMVHALPHTLRRAIEQGRLEGVKMPNIRGLVWYVKLTDLYRAAATDKIRSVNSEAVRKLILELYFSEEE